MDKSKIYGVQINCGEDSPICKRLADAQNMKNDYVIGESFANAGENDFDNAYPFGAMRLCCVTVKNGKKSVIYENEPAFARDGSAGNVMVEIPKFYSKREKENLVEKWFVSGEMHNGFSLDPIFVNGDRELDFVYVGVYNSTSQGNGIFSSNCGIPDMEKRPDDFEREFNEFGYSGYDFAIMTAIQKLMVIEFANRDLKMILGGLQNFSYGSRVRENNMVLAAKNNTVTVRCKGKNGGFFKGSTVGIGKGRTEADTIRKTVLNIEKQDETYVITYDGEDISDKIVPLETAIYGVVQPNGLSDCIPYHTGRCDHHIFYPFSFPHLVQPFRYRYIENVWGNVWELVSGLKIKELTYYYTFETDKYLSELSEWNKLSFKAPVQNLLPNIDCSRSWVTSFGFDPSCPSAIMPDTAGEGDHDKKFGGVCYAYADKDYENKPVDPKNVYHYAVGAGFDHTWGSLFTVRGFISENSKSWLYGNRLVLR